MPERRRERRREQKEPTGTRRQDASQEKQTKFVISASDLAATPEEIQDIKSALLRSAVNVLKDFRTTTGEAVARPQVSTELFSLSFSLSFSLGFGEAEELAQPTR